MKIPDFAKYSPRDLYRREFLYIYYYDHVRHMNINSNLDYSINLFSYKSISIKIYYSYEL